MRITVLDGYALNPGDLSWTELEKFGKLTVYDRTEPDQLPEIAKDAEILLTNKTVLDHDTLMALPDLKYIGVLATGYNVVDTKTARELGITVTNIPAYSTESVAQMVFAHLLAITNRVEHYTSENRRGLWCKSHDFCYCDTTMMELAGKTFGIVGFGHIGQAVGRIAQAFGMKVQAYTSKEQEALPSGVRKVSIDDLFETSDVISLHCPLTEETHHIVNAHTINLMRPNSILINTGRGPLVDESALAAALNNGAIRAAGIDVMSSEPPHADNPLLSADRCFITPHLAWATPEARRRLMDIAANNIHAYLAGTPRNVVNP